MKFMFSPMDQMILQQYKCGAEPAVQLSKFFQNGSPTFHLILLNLQIRIAEMHAPKFLMYADWLHSAGDGLNERTKTATVLTDSVVEREGVGRVEPIVPGVAEFRCLFADDLERRCQLAEWDEGKESLQDIDKLITDIAIACLLHPLAGCELP
jgi:hypothetical protein